MDEKAADQIYSNQEKSIPFLFDGAKKNLTKSDGVYFHLITDFL